MNDPSKRTHDVYAYEGRGLVRSWTVGVPFEASAKEQVRHMAGMPFIHKWVAVMPDVHTGIGATVGSVIATRGAVIPAAVGVDIGCGMAALRTTLTSHDLPDNLSALRSAIEAAVPHGRSDNGGANDKGAHRNKDRESSAWANLRERFEKIAAKYPKIDHRYKDEQLGTLGGGNHFIEVCLDEEDRVWVVLHSGSRGIGNRIGVHFISLAKEDMQRWFIHLPDADLAYFPEGSVHFDDYVRAVEWAQEYAAMNRSIMMSAVVGVLDDSIGKEFWTDATAINCHHNYISREHHYGANVIVTRKGAVRARTGDLGIIPGSMGAKSFIVRGLGNPESFHSCSHGAGRVMSRTEARRTFTVDDHVSATAGVECRKDVDVLDETPAAYKSIDAVMHAQRDLVEIVHTLKQVLCVKG